MQHRGSSIEPTETHLADSQLFLQVRRIGFRAVVVVPRDAIGLRRR